VATDCGLKPRVLAASLNHRPSVRGPHRSVGEGLRSSVRSAEERPFLVLGDARGLDIRIKIFFKEMMGGHLVELSGLPHLISSVE
jgi:hypothetical protein